MPGFMKVVSKNSHPAQAFFFFSPELTIEKLKGMPIFFPLIVYIPFIALLSAFFSLLHGLETAFGSCEIKVHMGDFTQIIDTVFM